MRKLLKIRNLVFLIVMAAFVLLVPVLMPNQYMMTVMNNAIIYFIAILGLSVMLGMGGQVTFSIAGTMGVGAFVVAISTVTFGWHPILAIIAAIAFSSIMSYLLGIALFLPVHQVREPHHGHLNRSREAPVSSAFLL